MPSRWPAFTLLEKQTQVQPRDYIQSHTSFSPWFEIFWCFYKWINLGCPACILTSTRCFSITRQILVIRPFFSCFTTKKTGETSHFWSVLAKVNIIYVICFHIYGLKTTKFEVQENTVKLNATIVKIWDITYAKSGLMLFEKLAQARPGDYIQLHTSFSPWVDIVWLSYRWINLGKPACFFRLRRVFFRSWVNGIPCGDQENLTLAKTTKIFWSFAH